MIVKCKYMNINVQIDVWFLTSSNAAQVLIFIGFTAFSPVVSFSLNIGSVGLYFCFPVCFNFSSGSGGLGSIMPGDFGGCGNNIGGNQAEVTSGHVADFCTGLEGSSDSFPIGGNL